jgi:hypothetical protein
VEKFIVNGLAEYGVSSANTTRYNPLAPNTDLTTDNIPGSEFLAAGGVSLPIAFGSFDVAPYGREIVQIIEQNAASEGPADAALSVARYSGEGSRSMIGVAAGSLLSNPLLTPFTYQFNLATGVDAGGILNPTVDATLAGLPTTITAPHVGAEFVQASLSATIRLSPSAYTYFQGAGLARSGGAQGIFTAGVRIQF